MPVIALPGLRHPGASRLQPVQARDIATCIARIVEHPKAFRRVIEVAGPEVILYREMLGRLRRAQDRGAPLWLPLPWWLMKLSSRIAQWLPQRVFSLDTMRMLQAGTVASHNEAARWLGREPEPMDATAGASTTMGFASIG